MPRPRLVEHVYLYMNNHFAPKAVANTATPAAARLGGAEKPTVTHQSRAAGHRRGGVRGGVVAASRPRRSAKPCLTGERLRGADLSRRDRSVRDCDGQTVAATPPAAPERGFSALPAAFSVEPSNATRRSRGGWRALRTGSRCLQACGPPAHRCSVRSLVLLAIVRSRSPGFQERRYQPNEHPRPPVSVQCSVLGP